ncbi:MAG: IclR family transcriptional regulator [Rhodospirillaceae bacterium]|nr:IclR family transcriptional regulator [Rhodospirillaceae bacterium]
MDGRGSTKASGREPLGIQSVEVAARILRALAEGGGVLPLRELAAATGMHRGKVHRYLISLARAGLVSREAEAGSYSIGPLAITAGLAGLYRLDPVRLAYEALPALRDRIGETVLLAVWGENGATVIALENSATPVTLNVRVGSVLPLRTSAAGRIFAAFLPEAAARAVRGGAPREKAALESALAAIRADGIAWVEGTLIPGLNAAAVPVFDHLGKLALAIGAVGRRETMSPEKSGAVARALIEGAAALSRRLGYAGGRATAATPVAASGSKRRR